MPFCGFRFPVSSAAHKRCTVAKMPTTDQRQHDGRKPSPTPKSKSTKRTNGVNGHAVEGVLAPFDQVCGSLLENGFSPTALEPKSKLLYDPGWTRWCRSPMTPAEIAARKGQGRNVAVATGYNRLAAIDIDAEDPAVEAAVRAIIPESAVAKRGRRGRTDFYRLPEGASPASRQFRDTDGNMLVELLGDGRQTVIPPSIHPDTHQPYMWLSDATLLDTCIDDLPECPADIVERLQQALKPWLPEKPAPLPRSGPPPVLTDDMKKRQRAWALKALDGRVAELAAKAKPGRDRMLLALVCALGKFVHHGIITDAELRAPALEACKSNGLIEDNQRRNCERTINNGLRYSLEDELGDLPEREKAKKAAPPRREPPPPELDTADVGDPSLLQSFDPSQRAVAWLEVTKIGTPVSKSQANIRAFLKAAGCTLSHNAFTGDISVTMGDATGELNEARRCRLAMAMHRLGLNPSMEFLSLALHDLALESSYHPVRDYLSGLHWDGTPRLDSWVITYLGADDTELNRAFGSKHLLAAVKRVFEPGCKKDEVLVLEGKTGIGKSSAISILAHPWFTDALKIGQDSKEVIELTNGSWLVEFAEMEGMGQREMGTLKATLSRRVDTARLAYARATESRPRQWVPFGTCNRTDYLRDASGNRRFWPLVCRPVAGETVDLAGLMRDRDQIWAEATHRLQQGESIALPKGLWVEAAAAQNERMRSSPWKMLLETALDGKTGRIAIAEIFRFLGLGDRSRQDPKAGSEIADIMTQLEWKKSRARGYGGKSEREHCYTKGEDTSWFSLV